MFANTAWLGAASGEKWAFLLGENVLGPRWKVVPDPRDRAHSCGRDTNEENSYGNCKGYYF